MRQIGLREQIVIKNVMSAVDRSSGRWVLQDSTDSHGSMRVPSHIF